MPKRVFEFTDEEVCRLLAEKLVRDGTAEDRDYTATIEVQYQSWRERGFIVRVKLTDRT